MHTVELTPHAADTLAQYEAGPEPSASEDQLFYLQSYWEFLETVFQCHSDEELSLVFDDYNLATFCTLAEVLGSPFASKIDPQHAFNMLFSFDANYRQKFGVRPC